jgi:hypothetical protein
VGRHATIHASAWPYYSAPVRRGHCDHQDGPLPCRTDRGLGPFRCLASMGARARLARPPTGCAGNRHGSGHGRGASEGRSPPVTRAGHAWCETTCFGQWGRGVPTRHAGHKCLSRTPLLISYRSPTDLLARKKSFFWHLSGGCGVNPCSIGGAFRRGTTTSSGAPPASNALLHLVLVSSMGMS